MPDPLTIETLVGHHRICQDNPRRATVATPHRTVSDGHLALALPKLGTYQPRERGRIEGPKRPLTLSFHGGLAGERCA